MFGLSSATSAIGSLGLKNYFGSDNSSGGNVSSAGGSAVSGGFDPWTVASQFASDTATGYINNYYARKSMKRQFEYNKALMDYANEYNSPKNQMARLSEAGLNPNLVYGNGSATIGSATGSVSGRSGTQPATNMLAAYNLEEQKKLLQAQNRLTNANWAYTVDNSLMVQERMREQMAKSDIAQYQKDYAEREHDAFERTGKIPESYYKHQATPQFLLRLLDNLAGM